MPTRNEQRQQQQSHDEQPSSSTRHGTSNSVSNLRSLFSPSTSTNLLSDLAPQILHPSILGSPHFSSRGSATALGHTSSSLRSRLGLGWGAATTLQDSNSIYIREKVEDLLRMEVPPAPFELSPANANALGRGAQQQQRIDFPAPDSQVPLIRGFLATTPAARSSRLDRRRKRAGLGEQVLGLESGSKLGLKERGDKARGLLGGGGVDEDGDGLLELGINRRTSGVPPKRKKRAGRRSEVLGGPAGSLGAKSGLGAVEEENLPELTLEELEADSKAVGEDMSNVAVRRALLNGEIAEVDKKIAALDAIREGLRRNLLGLREEELELEDELEGIQERIRVKGESQQGRPVSTSSRRRKGPAFLPGEHDELPSGVAFMTLTGHLAPITALDFSEPYGVAVTASHDQSVRLWDLTTGDEMGYLRGHRGAVKVLQVESSVCVTGGVDGQIRIWDLDAAESAFPLASPTTEIDRDMDGLKSSMENVLLGRMTNPMDDVFGGGAGLVNGLGGGEDEGMMREDPSVFAAEKEEGPCVKTLDGHSKAVTSLYFDGSCLVTGSNDSTLRQWDLQTGQCVLTMDILWAISNPAASQTLSSNDGVDDTGFATPASSPRKSLGQLRRQSSSFLSPGSGGGAGFGQSPTTTTYADGSWEMYDDFVGGVQFWGYALASGTGDGCVRMWDMRTGQAHRTLVGHTGPVTCVQFDEMHLVSGSLDKSIRIWDLRTGSISDTIRYEHPITGLQFDSRKIVAAAGENGVRVFNRTTLQHTALTINGHTSPVERLRFMDSYLSTGGRDNTVKIWRL